jgi:hypothetical protein
MTDTATRPRRSALDLWRQANGQRGEYRRLLREHGYDTVSDANRKRINWDLIQSLYTKPHPNQNHVHDPDGELPMGVGEVLQEALAAQHLLDLIGIAPGMYDDCDIDARTFLVVLEVNALRGRLDRITSWHSRESGPGGMVGDFCNECGVRWPCETRRMADGTHEDLTATVEEGAPA